MNAAAVEVMKELPDLCIAYGVSDEFRCVYLYITFNIFADKIPALSSTLTANSSSGGVRKCIPILHFFLHIHL
jgi:tRNA(His) 5'-end guanylyltransferase